MSNTAERLVRHGKLSKSVAIPTMSDAKPRLMTLDTDKAEDTASARQRALIPKGWLGRVADWLKSKYAASPAARSYRYLARQIELDLPHNEGGRTILVSSLGTMQISNETLLMISYFMQDELGCRILLVDGTFRAGGVSTQLGNADTPGFIDLVYGKEHAVLDLVRPTPRRGIALLPAGRTAVNRTVPLQSSRVVEILDETRLDFDYILVQQASILEDSRYLRCASGADLILLLVEEGITYSEEFERCKRIFRDHQISNVRLVLSTPD